MDGRPFKLGVWRQDVALASCEPIAVGFALMIRSGTCILWDSGAEKTLVQVNFALAIAAANLIVIVLHILMRQLPRIKKFYRL